MVQPGDKLFPLFIILCFYFNLLHFFFFFIDAIEFYCIQNVREPARLLGFGLNRYYSLIDELKHCDMADVKQLFCHSHPKNAILSAKMMKELFKVSPEDAKTPAYKNWLRFLDELEKKSK